MSGEHEIWWCGPKEDRRRFSVSDVGQLLVHGEGVVRADRDGADDGYCGPVALKLTSNVEPATVDKLRRRIDVIGELRHPNLARPCDVFVGPGLAREPEQVEDVDDVLYLATRWEPGTSLRTAAPLGPSEVVDLLDDVAAGVDRLHEAGLAHRDLHPGNVVIRPDGTAVVIDFGTVRPDDGQDTATLAGVPGFIAPDVAMGGSAARGDRWAVGMLGIFALLGHPRGSTPLDRLRPELLEAVDTIADPDGFVDALLAVTATEPNDRLDLALGLRTMRRALHDGSSSKRSARRTVLLGAIPVALAAMAVGFVPTTSTLRRSVADVAEAPPPDGIEPADPVRAVGVEPVESDAPAVPCRAPVDVDGDLTAGAALVPDGACWAEEPQALMAGTSRSVSSDGTVIGAVIESPTGASVFLPSVVWQSYREIAGRSQVDNSVRYGGFPTSIDVGDGAGPVRVGLDRGGVLVGPRVDTQQFWLPEAVSHVWSSGGGGTGPLGFPMSNVKITPEGAVVDFEHGFMRAEADHVAAVQAGETTPIETVVVDRGAAPTSEPAARSSIIRQKNGVAWWIDGAGDRHWIPDGGVWNCLGSDEAVSANELDGWVVASFPLAEPATCDG